MSEWYWLVDGEVVPAPPGRYLQPIEDRKVGYDELGDPEPYVSTVFLGLDHGYGGNHAPVVFETMVFWGGHEFDNDGERYYTLDEAKSGHQKYVERVKMALNSQVTKSWTFPVLAGAAIRGDIKRQILAYGASHGIDIQVKEEKGALESLYVFTATATPDKLAGLKGSIAKAVSEYNKD